MTGTVERLNVETVAPMPRAKPPVFMPESEMPKENVLLRTFNEMLPVFAVLATILAIRLFLLFAIVGAFILAQTALSDTSDHGIWVLAVYCVFTILPLAWLETQKKKSD